MSLKDAGHTIKGIGKTIWQNAPGPRELGQGFLETHFFSPALPFLVGIAFLLLFGEPIVRWLTRH